MAKYFNPKNFALIAGEAIDPAENIPRIFSYYAEDDVPEDIVDTSTPQPFSGNGFFGLWLPGHGLPLLPNEKPLPTVANLLCPGCGIMIYGPHQDDIDTPGYDKYWIMYLRVTSLWKEDTAYTSVFYYAQP